MIAVIKVLLGENIQREIDTNLFEVFYEYRFNIPNIVEECIGEHRFGVICGNCGGVSFCFDYGKQGEHIEPFG